MESRNSSGDSHFDQSTDALPGQDSDGRNTSFRPGLGAVADILRTQGVLDVDASPDDVKAAVKDAVGKFARLPEPTHGHASQNRKECLPQERLSRSHQIVRDAHPARRPKAFIAGGMKRALERLDLDPASSHLANPYMSANLPPIPATDFSANRRLIDTIATAGNIDGLDQLVAETLQSGGKRGFVAVRDLLTALRRRDAERARQLEDAMSLHLSTGPQKLLRTIRAGRIPKEIDFS